MILPPDKLATHGKFLRLMIMAALGELMNERTIPEDRVLLASWG